MRVWLVFSVCAVVLDGHPASLSWLGGVQGHRTIPLGVNRFGQSGDLVDLYGHYKIDTDAVVEAAEQVASGLS